MSSPEQVAADLAELQGAVLNKSHQLVVLWTAALQKQVALNASGRPGPNAPTGNYRRSINRRTTRLAFQSIGMVGTNAPQALRLEFGFQGTDALGRSYNQPAYPHFGPALDFVGAGFEHAMAALADPRGS